VRITADTNLFVRFAADDDHEQFRLADAVLRAATFVAVPTVVLCELAWVLRGRRVAAARVAEAIARILDNRTVRTDRAAAEAGLAMLRAGGDFADGAIAQSGAALGGALFVSFDAHAVALRRAGGHQAATPDELATAT
jgi:predicted nucleic-acid-binding protein